MIEALYAGGALIGAIPFDGRRNGPLGICGQVCFTPYAVECPVS